MMCSRLFAILLCVSLLVTACGRQAVPEAEETSPATLVTVMTFNVENLFDNVDDPDKNDQTFLPIEAKQSDAHVAGCNKIPVAGWRTDCLEFDWSDQALEGKLSALGEAIRQVNDGQGADIIALQEVENIGILERLQEEELAGLGYEPAILIEGADVRGIDVAFLSKFPLADEPILQPFDIPEFPDRAGDTRGVLQATFVLPDGSHLTAFAVHFPAPFHPTEMRVAAYQHLNELLAALPDDHHVVAAGDFNTTSTEADETGILDTYARPLWTLAHEIGCSECKGTYYYARDTNWSFLDMILFLPARGAKTTAQIRGDSVAIANDIAAQNTENDTPQRYEPEIGTGVSDHWPLIATIELTIKQ